MTKAQLIEVVAKAIAKVDELYGAPAYAERIAMSREIRQQLHDEAEAALDAVQEALSAAWRRKAS